MSTDQFLNLPAQRRMEVDLSMEKVFSSIYQVITDVRFSQGSALIFVSTVTGLLGESHGSLRHLQFGKIRALCDLGDSVSIKIAAFKIHPTVRASRIPP